MVLPLAAFQRALHGISSPSIFATIVYGVGRFICHQRPERSFFWADAPWPVCARCAGIYTGAAIAALMVFCGQRVRRYALSPAAARRSMVVASMPALASLIYEWTTGSAPSNFVRAATGVVIGGVTLWILMTFVDEGSPPASTSEA
jgi:uncharacterized membrane protein